MYRNNRALLFQVSSLHISAFLAVLEETHHAKYLRLLSCLCTTDSGRALMSQPRRENPAEPEVDRASNSRRKERSHPQTSDETLVATTTAKEEEEGQEVEDVNAS